RRQRHLQGHRSRHLQGRSRGRSQGQADAGRISHRSERRDGEVPVEIRSPGKIAGNRNVGEEPMASLGSALLLAAFVMCSYAAVISVVGARRRARRLIESGIGAFYLVAALMTAASAVMINAFLTGDFSIKYVVHYSDSVQPFFYKITSYWGGLDGSIMFLVFLLSVFGSVSVYVNRERLRDMLPYILSTLSLIIMY